MDWDISKEEYLLLEQSYDKHGDFLKALESLPKEIQDMFLSHIWMALSNEHREKKSEFESEYNLELKALNDKWINTEPVIVFVSRSFYKTPRKYRKYEHPKRRMRRTFKIALLRLLRTKLWNVQASIVLEKFEKWENFEDLFMLLFKLLEVINEDTSWEEIYSLLKLDEDIRSDVVVAEENKQKILDGESLVMKIANLFSKSESHTEEEQLDEWLLAKVLDENTDIVWEDIYFNREDDKAGIYDEWAWEQRQDDEEEINYDNMSPRTAHEMLEHRFHAVEEKKRQAFLQWKYDDIDMFNQELLFIESKLWKLCLILWIE